MVKAKSRRDNKKTRDGYEEDALYREVWEEVHTQKIYEFMRRHIRLIGAAAIAVVLTTAGIVTVRHINHSNAMEVAQSFESAMDMNPVLAREALSRLAKSTRGGMGDMALFRAYRLAWAASDRADAAAKLEKLAENGSTRDFRDLALVQLAMLKSEDLTADEFQKMLAPLLTKRSPFYFTGLLFVAEKYLAEDKAAEARPFLRKITTDHTAPASVSAVAEQLAR